MARIDSDIDSGSDRDSDRLGRMVTVVRQVDGVVEMATIYVTRMRRERERGARERSEREERDEHSDWPGAPPPA